MKDYNEKNCKRKLIYQDYYKLKRKNIGFYMLTLFFHNNKNIDD